MVKVDIDFLKEVAGEANVKHHPADLYVYGSDASVHSALPSAVVQPRTAEQIQEIVRYADAEMIPVIARGAGSSTSGHSIPIDGGIVLDMKRMNRILEIRPEDIYCTVEPGVVDGILNRALKPYGVFYPPSPASSRIATIGGEIGANASGMRSVKYGATRDVVLGLKVVLANGDLVRFGSKTRVASVGYPMEKLMVGSEGTLGIVVEATLKVVPIPKLRCLGMAAFQRLHDAGEAISEIIAGAAEPSMLELMDKIGIIAVNRNLNLGLPEVDAVLLFEADGKLKAAVDFEIEIMRKICEKHGGEITAVSYDEKERNRIYMGRKKLFSSLSRYKKGIICTDLADDMGVPNSKVVNCAEKIRELAEKYDLMMSVYGHCGSGVVHTKIMMDVTKPHKWGDARKAIDELYDYVHELGGVISGEHGIALSKAPAWKKARKDLIPILKRIKRALDPNNIMNPHKLMDAPSCWVTATDIRYPVSDKSVLQQIEIEKYQAGRANRAVD